MKLFKILGTVVVCLCLAVITFLTFRFLSGDEDVWLCQDGQWVRHGNPSQPAPVGGCGEEKENDESAGNLGLANPASVNCVDKGGKLEIKTDQEGGQYGICTLPGGQQCEEWSLYRGECSVEVDNENSHLTVVLSPSLDLPLVSPLNLRGTMPGNWFFEATAQVVLLDGHGQVLAVAPAMTKGDWMTDDPVEFSAELEFDSPNTATGTLILKNDNPSGLPENDKTEIYPVIFGTKVKVYYSNVKKTPGMPDCSQVFSVERSVVKTSALARVALEELLKGPTEAEKVAGYLTNINSGVMIQKLTIENKTALVDFSSEIEDQLGGSCRVSAIRAQIENTLKQFSTVENVVISVNGRTEDILQP